MSEESTLGLALGGGAVLGAAHIGVLQALEESELEVTHLAGTSMGALVGSLFAFGITGAEIEALAEELRWPDVTGFLPSKLGLFSMDRLANTLRKHLGEVRVEDARVPLALLAADISTGEKVVMTDGDLATAATASACVPGLFIPIEREGRLLVDGGLLENLPVSPLRAWGVDRVIAVDVHMGRRFGPERCPTCSPTPWTWRWPARLGTVPGERIWSSPPRLHPGAGSRWRTSPPWCERDAGRLANPWIFERAPSGVTSGGRGPLQT
jgi:NTE family protein